MTQKLLLLSMVIATLAIPAWASKDPGLARGIKKAVFSMLLFNVVYFLAVLIVYPRLLGSP